MVYILGVFLSITFAKSHSKDLHIQTLNTQNIYNTKQTYNFTKDWVCVSMSGYSSNNCHLRL